MLLQLDIIYIMYICVCVYICIYLYCFSSKLSPWRTKFYYFLVPGQEDPLEKAMATHSSIAILAWRIPWIEKPGRLQSIGSQRVGHGGSDLAHLHVQEYCYLFLL